MFLSTIGLIRPTQKVQATSPWYDVNWRYRKAITINNTGGGALTDYQVKVTLNNANFDFSKAKTDGSDIRFTDSDETTLINYWIESYNSVGQTAVLWSKVPNISAGSTKIIYIYYGNSGASSASSGNNTFSFFDNFETPTQAYFQLSNAQTVMVATQACETSSPHTIDIVELNKDGYKYWGYYGLQNSDDSSIGLAWSEDLINWTKYGSNPIVASGRWAQAIKSGDTIYLTYNTTPTSSGNTNLMKSTDGINFSFVAQMAAAEPGGNLFLNPVDGKYYYYHYKKVGVTEYNLVRWADTVEGLPNAVDTVIFNDRHVRGDVIYRDGIYYMPYEYDNNGVWTVDFYYSHSPISNFIYGGRILSDDSACFFQQEIGGMLYDYYCKRNGLTWTLAMRSSDFTAGTISTLTEWINSAGDKADVRSTEQARDGNYSMKLDTVEEFSPSLGSQPFGSISAKHWFYTASTTGRRFTASILDSGGNNTTDSGAFIKFEGGSVYYNNGVWNQISGLSFSTGWNSVEILQKSATQADIWVNGTKASNVSNRNTISNIDKIYVSTANEFLVSYTDDFLVRKYASVEPTNTVGSEITLTSPTVTVQPADSITTSSAVLHGTITDVGTQNATTRGFKYYQSADCTGTENDKSENGSFGAEAYSLSLAGLSSSTVYSYKAYATSPAGTGTSGTCETFTTLAGPTPTPTPTPIPTATPTPTSTPTPTATATAAPSESATATPEAVAEEEETATTHPWWWRLFYGTTGTTTAPSSDTFTTIPTDLSNIEVGQEITFDASPLGSNITSYEWNFGDGATANGVKVNHKYETPGRYTVTLITTDKEGNKLTYTKTIDIRPPAPTISNIKADGPSIVFEGKSSPETIVSLTIHSDPYAGQAIADKDGEFTYTVEEGSETLGEGDHTVLASATVILSDNTELKSKDSKTYDFKVSVDNGKLKVEMGKTRIWQIVSLALGGIIITGLAVHFLRRKRRKYRLTTSN